MGIRKGTLLLVLALLSVTACDSKHEETAPPESSATAEPSATAAPGAAADSSEGRQEHRAMDGEKAAQFEALAAARRESPAENGLEAKARGIVERLTARDFESIVAEFDAKMDSVMSQDKLEEAWDILEMQAGAFVGQERVRTQEGVYETVFVTCTFERTSLDIKVVFNATEEISGLWFVETKEPVDDTPPYAKPEAFEEFEVSVNTPDWPLPGMLTLPKGDGPFPAVVLVHGSGPHDRDETLGPNKPFRDLAWGLGTRGVAVLRYDKRTKVYGAAFHKQGLTITVKEEAVDDALTAVSILRDTPRVDATRIVVLGHSLGGMLVPRIAAAAEERAVEVAGFIVMAGPARPLAQSILNQTIYLAELDDAISEEERARFRQIEAALEQIEALGEGAADAPGAILGVPNAYWLDLKGYDAPVAAQEVTQPLLILQGKRDYQVTLDDFARWEKALDYREDVTFKVYPALNHLFIPGDGASTPAEYEALGHVDEGVIADIAEWISDTTI